MTLLRRLGEGNSLPRGWGYCWRNYDDWSMTVAPLGLNLLIAFAHWAWAWTAYRAPRWLNDRWPPRA